MTKLYDGSAALEYNAAGTIPLCLIILVKETIEAWRRPALIVWLVIKFEVNAAIGFEVIIEEIFKEETPLVWLPDLVLFMIIKANLERCDEVKFYTEIWK